MSFKGRLIPLPHAGNAGGPEGPISPLEEHRAVDLPAAGIIGIDGAALGFEEHVNVGLHGGGQAEPGHQLMELLHDVIGLGTMEMFDGKGDLHFTVRGFHAPALGVAGKDDLGRYHRRIEQGRGDDHELAALALLRPAAGE